MSGIPETPGTGGMSNPERALTPFSPYSPIYSPRSRRET